MPRGTQQLPSERSPDIEMIEEIERTPLSSSSSSQSVQETKSNSKMDVVENSKPGTSKPKNCGKARMITFHVNYLGVVHEIKLSELASFSK